MNNYKLSLCVIGIMFFTVGFALGVNSYLVPLIQSALNVTAGKSYLLLTSTFSAFVIFSYPATYLISRVGYKNTMIASFVLFAIAFLMYVPSAKYENLGLFVIASFISGMANTVLQAAINPYATFLGPIDSAATRISFMGICNILAWPVAPVFLSAIVKKPIEDLHISEIIEPFYWITLIFIVIGIVLYCIPLQEIRTQEDKNELPDDSNEKKSIWEFPHLILGIIALFLYVGIETVVMSSSVDYATSYRLDNPERYAYLPSIGMILGYLSGIALIPRYLSQSDALKVFSWIALSGCLVMMLLPGRLAIYAVSIVAFGCSVMYPAIFPLAVRSLGRFTSLGTSLLVSALVGGAIIPIFYGLLKDMFGSKNAYIIAIPCFIFILFYAYKGHKIGLNDKNKDTISEEKHIK